MSDNPGFEFNGVWYDGSLAELLLALGKALIKKGVITKADILAELL